MKFLSDLNFDDKTIRQIEKNIPKLIKEQITTSKETVKENITFLKNLGIKNYQEAFKLYYDMFLIDPNDFKEIFNKYETDDLLVKLETNIAIIEHL